MNAYLKVIQDLAKTLEFFKLIIVLQGENVCANALTALGSKVRDKVKQTIPIHRIDKPSIELASTTPERHHYVNPVHATDDHPTQNSNDNEESSLDWRTPFLAYLANRTLPEEKWEARRLKVKIINYVVMDCVLYRWTANKFLLRCIFGDEVRLLMAETHKGAAGNHSGGRALALKIKSLGFYWPTLVADCEA
ncbi:hypothetical protein N665_1281s0002 [Sinapis alba]|nr:hypothetical protein N665_1281s0002 [Sinapis alba]